MIVTVEAATFSYPESEPALRDVYAGIDDGEFVLLAGPSAGGKSTFLRLLNGLVPQFHGGRLAGRVLVAGRDAARTPARQMASVAGMVFQEPEAQAVADTVEDDIAFGMEQHGVSRDEMARRLDHLLEALGIAALRSRRLGTLSGGERQRVAIASALVLEPRLLLMDEPTSQLDPAGAESVLRAVQELHCRGLTVVLAEHRLERLLPIVDRVFEVRGGRVRALSPRDAGAQLAAVPPVCALARTLGLAPMPLTDEEARVTVRSVGRGVRVRPGAAPPATGAELVRVSGISVAYGGVPALSGVSLQVREGEVVALVGPNGSGKSTLMRAITGLVETVVGQVRLSGQEAPDGVQRRTALAGLVPQDPAMALYKESVRDEIADTLRHRRGPGRLGVEAALDAWGVAELAERNPRDLSVGQQQRVAVAAMLAQAPRTWLMDEPTRGADDASKAWLAGRLREHAARGGAAIVATHDIESAARYATRVVALQEGKVLFDLPARTAFGTGGPLATQAARIVPGAIVPEDVQGWAA